MRMNRKGALFAGAAVMVAAVAAACSDSATGPTQRAAFVPKANMAVGDLTNATAVATQLKICKTGDVGGTFTTTDVGDGDASGNPSIQSPLNVAPGECRIAVIDEGDATFSIGDFFTVSEADQPNVTETLVQCVINGGAVLPCPAQFFINTAHGWTLTFNNHAEPPGDEGCTPGYWKQDQHFGSWAPVALNTTFSSVFGAGIFGGTLLEALGLNGGELNALIRHGAAAYLNASNGDVDYAYTTAQVIDIVQGDGAYAGLTVEERKDLLDAANNGIGGCPLGRNE